VGPIAITPKRLICYIVAGGIFAAGLAAFFVGRSALASQLDTWKMLPRPERFTELYFAQSSLAALPTRYTPGGLQTVSFAVHNLEHQATTYHYTVVAQAGRTQRALAAGQFLLAHGDVQRVARGIAVPPLGNRQEIVVRLQYSGIPFGANVAKVQKQTIHYWINRAT